MDAVIARPNPAASFVDFQTAPSRYRHWKLSIEGRVATLAAGLADDVVGQRGERGGDEENGEKARHEAGSIMRAMHLRHMT